MIGVRPPAQNSELPVIGLDVGMVDAIGQVRIRNRRVIEQTRASLGELRFQRARMHTAVTSMRNELELARVLRDGVALRPRSVGMSAPKRSLSERELQVLKLVAAGLPNKQVAVRLGISERTVRNHMTEIFTKLRVQNRTEAVLKALQIGLLIV